MHGAGDVEGDEDVQVASEECATGNAENRVHEEAGCVGERVAEAGVPEDPVVSQRVMLLEAPPSGTYAQNFLSVYASPGEPKYGGQSAGAVKNAATPIKLTKL